MIAEETLDYLLVEALTCIAPPPPPRRLLDFTRALRYPDGPEEGQTCDPESHVATYEILRAFAEGGHDEIVTLGPVQDTKTWSTTTVPTLYSLIELRRSVVLGWPDRPLASKYWRSKFRPTLEAAGYARLLPEDGPGSDGGAPEDVLFSTGARLYLLGAGAKNEAGQSMITAPIVGIEERDSIRPRWVELLNARNQSYGERRRNWSTSTLKEINGVKSTTLEVYNSSLGYRPYFRCEQCAQDGHASGGWQTFEVERFRYDGNDDVSAAETAHIVCVHNAAHRFDESTRRRMITGHRWVIAARGQTVLADGTVVGDRPRSRIWGLRWTALDSPLKPLPQLAVKHRQALERRDAYGDHEALRQFYRDLWVMEYREDVEGAEGVQQFTPVSLAARSGAFGWDTIVPDKPENGLWSRYAAPIPEGASMASLAVDVQGNRCYWALLAADAELRTWDVAWGYEYATAAQEPTSTGELHQILDRIRELLPSLVEHEDRKLPVIARGIDVGDRQDEIVSWLAGNPQWLPLSGAGEEAAGRMRSANAAGDLAGVVYRRTLEGSRLHPRQLLHMVDVERVREQAQTGFLRPANAAGAAHLPRGLKAKDAYLHHLVGMKLTESAKTGLRKWVVVNKRHDYLDCRTYNLALLRLHLRNVTLTPPKRRYGVVGTIGG